MRSLKLEQDILSTTKDRGKGISSAGSPVLITQRQQETGNVMQKYYEDSGTMTCAQKLHIREFGLHHKHPKYFVTLEFGRPVHYVVWTLCWAVFHLVWMCLEGYWWSLKTHYTTLQWFTMMSNVGYTLLTATSIIEFFVATYTHCYIRIESPTMPWYYKLSWFLYNMSNTTASLITLSYWVLLARTYVITAATINKHGINFIYTLIIICCTSKPIKFQHFYIPAIFSFTYMIFTCFYFIATGRKLYSLLNWRSPGKAVMWTILYAFVCTPLMHFSLFGIFKLKQFIKMKISKRGKTTETQQVDPEAKVGMLPQVDASVNTD